MTTFIKGSLKVGQYNFSTYFNFNEKPVVYIEKENGEAAAFEPKKFEALMDKFWKENF